LRGIAAAEGNHMFYGQGAVPIFRQGVLIGACGVGGGIVAGADKWLSYRLPPSC